MYIKAICTYIFHREQSVHSDLSEGSGVPSVRRRYNSGSEIPTISEHTFTTGKCAQQAVSCSKAAVSSVTLCTEPKHSTDGETSTG